MKIQHLDRQTVKFIAKEMSEAMEAVANKYGLNIRYRGGSFTGKNVTYKFEVATLAEDGQAETKERTDWKTKAVLYGMKPEWLDQSFVMGGYTYIIRGLNPRAHKMPVLVERMPGKQRFKMAQDVVRNQMTTTNKAVATDPDAWMGSGE